MEKYLNRSEAGKILANKLKVYSSRGDVLIFALPRGGVPVAYEIAHSLKAPLDVFIVRKLGVPGHEELAMGAIAMGNTIVFNKQIVDDLSISQSAIDTVIEKESKELKRRESVYRNHQPFPNIKNKVIILVDDGIATGATIRVAIKALRSLEPSFIIAAIPVADISICSEMESLVDLFICPLRPSYLYAVGAWYDDFSQTEDAEVHQLLDAARKNFAEDNHHA